MLFVGLGGETSIEQCMVDSCVDAVSDILLTMTKAHFEKDPDKKASKHRINKREKFQLNYIYLIILTVYVK